MKPVKDWVEADLDEVVSIREKENLNLDYKASAALDFGNLTPFRDGKGTIGAKHRDELIKDVSAMANAEGGTVIYGIEEENDGYPKCVDDGFAGTKTAERIEQILLTNIHPRLEAFATCQIPLVSKGRGTSAFAVAISKASTNAPHQAADLRYYKRHVATSQAMEDYEIRDMMRRSIEFGKKFGAAWDLLFEMRRISTAARHREEMGSVMMPRKSLQIDVSNGIRNSGVALMLLPRDIRNKLIDLANALDRYNTQIELADQGQRENARLNELLRAALSEIGSHSYLISEGLQEVLKEQPN